MRLTILWSQDFTLESSAGEVIRQFDIGEKTVVQIRLNGLWTTDGHHLRGIHEAEYFIFVRNEE